MTIARNGDEYTYRFFIDSCNMMWCYCKAVGQTDATTIANYQLEAGLWEISALMNLQNLILVSLYLAIWWPTITVFIYRICLLPYQKNFTTQYHLAFQLLKDSMMNVD